MKTMSHGPLLPRQTGRGGSSLKNLGDHASGDKGERRGSGGEAPRKFF